MMANISNPYILDPNCQWWFNATIKPCIIRSRQHRQCPTYSDQYELAVWRDILRTNGYVFKMIYIFHPYIPKYGIVAENAMGIWNLAIY